MLKSRTSFPPGSFQFYQAETGWTSTPHIGFGPTVDEIIKHRQANPRFKLPTDRATVEIELDNYTSARLQSQYGDGASEWLTGGAPPAVFTRPSPRSRAVVGEAVAARSKAVAGVGLLVDWLGSGMVPVEQGLANARAEVCISCQFNQKPDALQAVYGVVANGLHLLMEAREQMKLSTPFDERLFTCGLCSCDLKLKSWAPIKHIKSNTPESVFNSLPDWCWIKKELTVS